MKLLLSALLLFGSLAHGESIPEALRGMWQLDADATAMALRDAGREAETALLLRRIRHYAYGFTENEVIGILEERRYTLPVQSVSSKKDTITIVFGEEGDQIFNARVDKKGILSLTNPQSNDLDLLRWKKSPAKK